MFKLAQAQARTPAAQQLQQKLRQAEVPLAATASRGIRNPSVVLPKDDPTRNRKHMYDIYGHTVGRLGILNLNKEHRFNTLSPSFAHEVARGIGSHYEDRMTKAIYVTTAKGKQWCNGTDFRTMLAMKQEGNEKRLADYLEQLYQLQTQVAKTNKPILAAAPGHAFNSGATLLAACGYPMMTIDSKMAFNECTFGFVPHSGATYYLSRLPQEFGTFLALTGMPIHGTDAAKLKLVDNVLQTTHLVEEEAADAVYSMGYDPRVGETVSALHEQRVKQSSLPEEARIDGRDLRNTQNMKLDTHARDRGALLAYQDILKRSRQFEEAHERIPSSTSIADGEYDHWLRQDQKKNQTETMGLFDYHMKVYNDSKVYQHQYTNTMSYMKQHVAHEFAADKTVAYQHMEMIARCFYSPTVEEIMQNLREEGSPFAEKCLAAMQRNSMLSMRLALKMLREANSLDYASCLRMEVKVASKMIETKEFDTGVQQVLMSSKNRKGQKHPNAANYPSKTEKGGDLDAFFEGADWAKDINVGAMRHSLLPTRHYYERFGDQVRLWINEQSTHQDDLRSTFDFEAKYALLEQGIDVRDKALTMQSAREHLAAKLGQERRQQVQAERAEQMMCDEKLRTKYFDQVDAEKQKLRDLLPAQFQAQIDDCINKVFEEAYIGRMQTIYDKSKEAQAMDRRRSLMRLKRFLFRTRCVERGGESYEKQVLRLENYDYKLPHLSETWTKSWLDMDHPEIQKSPLYYLSKALGRASLSPIQITQEYLTQPQLREQLSVLTVDKEELLRVQEDIYGDPQKYEDIFKKRDLIDWGHTRHFWSAFRRDEVDQDRLANHQYWHSMFNDGTDGGTNWPFYREYHAYKAWYDQIEDRALGTLKLAVASLLDGFKEEQVKSFEGKSETKRAQVERLLGMIENRETQIAEAKAAKEQGKSKKVRKLTSSKRDIDQISQLLDETLSEDVHLKTLFDKDQAGKHILIKKVQSKARAEILRLLEIVLLDKFHEPTDPAEKMLFKQRLASLMTPKGMKRDEVTHQQLQMIDAHLLNETGKATLKSALEAIKPFFLQYAENLLKEAGQEVAERFALDKTNHIVLPFFYMMQNNQGLQKREVVQRLLSYSKKQDNYKMLWEGVPYQDPNFKRRLLMNSFVSSEPIEYLYGEDVEAQKAKVEKEMLRQREAVTQFDSNLEAMNQELREDAEKTAKEWTSNPEGVKDVREFEQFWNDRERDELEALMAMYEQTNNFIMNHRYEFENNLSIFDWLKIYAQSVQDYGMDFNQTLDSLRAEGDQVDKLLANKSDEHWEKLASVASFLSAHTEAVSQYSAGYLAEMPDFLADHSALSNSASQASLWQLALSKRNEIMRERNSSIKADRDNIIRQQLADFNELRAASAKRDQIASRLELSAETAPGRVQQLIKDLLEAPQTYINFEMLADSVDAGSDPSLGLEKFIDVNQLVSDLQQKKGPSSVKALLLSSNLDVLSLAELQARTKKDSSLSKVERAQALSLLDYVSEAMAYVSNSSRQGLTMSEFFADHHASTSAAFSNFSAGLLQQKLSSKLGDKLAKKDSVDWDIDGVRTSPIDHARPEDATSYLSGVADEYETLNATDALVNVKDPETGVEDVRSVRDHAQIQILREAKRLTALTEDMEQYRNFYENQLILAMMQSNEIGKADDAQQRMIDEYLGLRFKTCMLNKDFASKVRNSDNGHYYLKVLRERVVEELGLTEEFHISDANFDKLLYSSSEYIKYDVDSMNNMQAVNNTQAMGYDALGKRTGSPSDAKTTLESSHESVFDKLLADYYLSQRGDYAEANKLMSQLTEVFEGKQKQSKYKHHLIHEDNIASYKLEQEAKQVQPFIHATAARSIFDLDVLTHRAVQGGKSGLCDELRELSIADIDHPEHYTTQVPAYFQAMDVRKKPSDYVADKLQQVVYEAFEARRKLERKMSRRELVAFDKVLSKYLQPENVLRRVDSAIAEDYGVVYQGRQMIEQQRLRETSEREQLAKKPNEQRAYNKSIKNEDAMYKQLAFGAMTEQKYKEQIANPDQLTHKHREYMMNPFTFERWYGNQLEIEAKKAPREINPADYEPKKLAHDPKNPPKYLDREGREEQFFEDHSLFLENKKEQQDRIKLFYILEQFYEQTREKPDPASSAQQHMKEYFSDPDNTFFFDKNKIQ